MRAKVQDTDAWDGIEEGRDTCLHRQIDEGAGILAGPH